MRERTNFEGRGVGIQGKPQRSLGQIMGHLAPLLSTANFQSDFSSKIQFADFYSDSLMFVLLCFALTRTKTTALLVSPNLQGTVSRLALSS